VSIRPLSQADLAAILGHHGDHGQPDHLGPTEPSDCIRPGRPVVAVRVRASVGRPGASAQAEYRRRRAGELATWRHSLPWRLAAVLAAATTTGGLAAAQASARPGLLAGLAVAILVGWLLRFRPSPEIRAWRRGAAGERRTARLLAPLERHGWTILHDLAIPGSPANLDHLVIGPGGVVVIDFKQYRGRLQVDPSGRLWHGRYPLAPAQIPWRKVITNGVPVLRAGVSQLCFAPSRRCWNPNESPPWPRSAIPAPLPWRTHQGQGPGLDQQHSAPGGGAEGADSQLIWSEGFLCMSTRQCSPL
jgi:hypothetical protein